VFLVADHDRILADVPFVVGFLIGTARRTSRSIARRQFGFIHDLWVEPDYRNEGLGRQMTMLAIETFRDMGMTQVRLETADCNDPARKLFASCGFRVATNEMLVELK
jgi:ribosomal protein S18 acetylase RimI-like enzyme